MLLSLCILQIFYVRYFHNLNLFYGNVSFLYFLKISENQTISNVFKEYRKGSLGRNGLIEEFVSNKAKGVRNVHFPKFWRALFSCYLFFEIRTFASLPTNLAVMKLYSTEKLPQSIVCRFT